VNFTSRCRCCQAILSVDFKPRPVAGRGFAALDVKCPECGLAQQTFAPKGASIEAVSVIAHGCTGHRVPTTY
jgi:hypothetical protein